jgi:thiol-disulfide isomerase/thioredoxin
MGCLKRVKTFIFSFTLVFFSAGMVMAQIPRKVIVEDFTGTWCGDCPKGLSATEHLEEKFGSSVICIGMHSGDALTNAYSDSVVDQCNVTEFPLGFIDRHSFFPTAGVFQELDSTTSWDGPVNDRLSTPAPVAVSILNTYDSVTREITVTVGARFVSDKQGYFRLNCLLVEDSVQTNGQQVNYSNEDPSSPWFHAGNPIEIYYQRNVARINLSKGTWGEEEVIPLQVLANEEYSKTYRYKLRAQWNDKRIRIVGFVSEWGDYQSVLDTSHFSILNAAMEKLHPPTHLVLNPSGFTYNKPFPNPFTDKTVMQVQTGTDRAALQIVVYSAEGKQLFVVADEIPEPGSHAYYWSGTNQNGSQLPAGIYFCRIISGSEAVTYPLILAH